jgi:hypothetical protein
MKFTTDFTTISSAIHTDIVITIQKDLNAKALFICKLSNHPEDDYLYLYIAQACDGYITGLANTSRDYGVGLYENHYNCTLKQAMEIMANKIKDCNKEEN